MLLMFLVTQVIFVCVFWKSCQRSSLCNILNMLFIRGMDVGREQYNVRHYGKYEILLLDTCLLYLYLSPEWVGQYLGTYHNNARYVSIAVVHDVYSYR